MFAQEPDLARLRAIFVRQREDAELTYDELAERSDLHGDIMVGHER